MPSITVLIPAYNEAVDIENTVGAIQGQTLAPDRILVVDDCSTDGTGDLARAMGVDVIRPDSNLGSKAKAQNYALDFIDTDLILPVDGDTVLAPDYVERLVPQFHDELVAVAAGCVLTQRTSTIWEKGRNLEYLFGFHWYRPVQHMAGAPSVCSGCCTVFRTEMVRSFGGFPERTMVEDIDMTWSQQIMGRKALYVKDAVAYAAEPSSAIYLRKQLWRWKSGWFQNVRLHYPNLWRHKPMLALWVTITLFDIIISPFVLSLPVLMALNDVPIWTILMIWLASEALTLFPPIIYGCVKRQVSVLAAISWYPSYYLLKLHNFFYDWKALITELIMVPMGWADGLVVYERGKA